LRKGTNSTAAIRIIVPQKYHIAISGLDLILIVWIPRKDCTWFQYLISNILEEDENGMSKLTLTALAGRREVPSLVRKATSELSLLMVDAM
jgi:hypothetical protein